MCPPRHVEYARLDAVRTFSDHEARWRGDEPNGGIEYLECREGRVFLERVAWRGHIEIHTFGDRTAEPPGRAGICCVPSSEDASAYDRDLHGHDPLDVFRGGPDGIDREVVLDVAERALALDRRFSASKARAYSDTASS